VSVRIECSGFSVGPNSPLGFASGKFVARARIPHTKALDVPRVWTTSYLGTVTSTPDKLEPICWEDSLGEFSVGDFYEFERSMEAPGRSLSRITSTEIHLSGIVRPDLVAAVLVLDMERAIEEPLRLLSLLSRQALRWYQITATFVPEDPAAALPVEYVKRRKTSISSLGDTYPIVPYNSLREGGFLGLLQRLRAPGLQTRGFKDFLLRAMAYCVASHHQPTIEAEASMTFLAVEALATGFARWRGAKGSLKDRLRAIVQFTKVRAEQLWPANVDVSDGLQKLVKKRNELIHCGRIADFEDFSRDVLRARILVEWSILSLLGWDPYRVNITAYWYPWLLEGQ
jgi:hypothetical protein